MDTPRGPANAATHAILIENQDELKRLGGLLLLRMRGLGVHEAMRADVVQDALLELHRLAVEVGERPEDPEAWAFTVARNRVRDHHRRQRRRPAASCAELDAAFDTHGLSPEHLRQAADGHLEARDSWRRFEAAVGVYVARAGARQPASRDHQVRAWLALQVHGESARRFADQVGTERGIKLSSEAVWKWCQRGREVVVVLAREDEDADRGELMLRVAQATAQTSA